MLSAIRAIGRIFPIAGTNFVKSQLSAFREKQLNQNSVQACFLSSIARLGSMDEGSYDQFVKRMHEVAKQVGIRHPTLGLSIEFKKIANLSLGNKFYPIKEVDWAIFKEEAEIMCDHVPQVCIVDDSESF